MLCSFLSRYSLAGFDIFAKGGMPAYDVKCLATFFCPELEGVAVLVTVPAEAVKAAGELFKAEKERVFLKDLGAAVKPEAFQP
jgi:hypothetical protein